MLNAFAETRTAAFFEAQEYLVNDLAREHKADLGVRGLPKHVRDYVRFVGLFYDDLGKLVDHHVIPHGDSDRIVRYEPSARVGVAISLGSMLPDRDRDRDQKGG